MRSLVSGENALIPGPQVSVEVNWHPSSIGADSIDASAFILDEKSKLRFDDDMLFFSNPKSRDGSVELLSDISSQGFQILLSKIPSTVSRIAFVLAIHGQATFAKVHQVEVRVPGIGIFVPATQHMTERAIVFGEIYRFKHSWKFRAGGQGFNGGLEPLAVHFGLNIR